MPNHLELKVINNKLMKLGLFYFDFKRQEEAI